MTYFVVGVDGLEPVSVLGEGELLGGGRVGRMVSFGRVLGEAEGDVVRSASPTRSLRSVHPVSTTAPSASTQTPESNFFIVVPPSWFRSTRNGCNGGAADPRVEVR